MFNISSFLKKFSTQLDSAQLHKKEICQILSMKTGLHIEEKQIEIKNYILFVDASPTVKSKIFINKKEILEECKKVFVEKIVDVK